MGILRQCPACKYRVSEGREDCRCGYKLTKHSGRIYWIEYYAGGKRRRERIGTNRALAKTRLEKVLVARAEERLLDKNKNVRHTLGELSKWYLSLPEVKQKASYVRDKDYIRHLHRLLGESLKMSNLTPGRVESYRSIRLAEPSVRRKGKNATPCTVNKEVRCLKNILNRAVRHGKIESNPIRDLDALPENNVRERILTQEEFDRLLGYCPSHIKPIVLMGYYLPMRKSEILDLVWGEVDLVSGFIRLPPERTKTKKARAIPIHPRVLEMVKSLPRGLHTDRVFLLDGKPLAGLKRSYKTACKNAGLGDFTFHDLRHCAINNLRLAGNDFFEIMAMSGHSTMSVFERYNLVTEEELKEIKWHDRIRYR
jgi:integrase